MRNFWSNMRVCVHYFILVSICNTYAEILTDFMIRIQQYDNKTIPVSKLLSAQITRSLSKCAAQCNRNVQCQSAQYSAETNVCRLISERLSSGASQEGSSSGDWKYYERKIDCFSWHTFNNHAYKLDATLRNFASAQQFCASLLPASYVIEIESQAENDWLIKLASSFCGMNTEFWLNLEDVWDKAPFKWLESGHTATFTPWIPGEPSNFVENCVVSSVNSDGGWNDIGCEALRPVVCERNP